MVISRSQGLSPYGALARVTRDRPHIEPEAVAALGELVRLAGASSCQARPGRRGGTTPWPAGAQKVDQSHSARPLSLSAVLLVLFS